ncbi:hypothetical protein SNOG_01162 [Parastagonospora nodorum SN15]|uniref:Uncharacterized protein n=1 Tax=Phaeosphaeria nodorum (strain SN15 / ATCC MYA-4574 / FGSC 10173) TaxID=321614 RepID=Q0V4A2_PHANO|nr:hypothetical protein SNOG_01162 [Parastagonospora nodorum SN15]EAT90811.1 hypothetical protein SNOG_01162 [Parastagonospora nodorum SN15]
MTVPQHDQGDAQQHERNSKKRWGGGRAFQAPDCRPRQRNERCNLAERRERSMFADGVDIVRGWRKTIGRTSPIQNASRARAIDRARTSRILSPVAVEQSDDEDSASPSF